MIPLPETFKQSGFEFKQLWREGQIAIFEKQKPGSEVKSYETVIIQQSDDYEIAGNLIKAHESMPGNETWGRFGFTYNDLLSARNRFNSLVKQSKVAQKGTSLGDQSVNAPSMDKTATKIGQNALLGL